MFTFNLLPRELHRGEEEWNSTGDEEQGMIENSILTHRFSEEISCALDRVNGFQTTPLMHCPSYTTEGEELERMSFPDNCI